MALSSPEEEDETALKLAAEGAGAGTEVTKASAAWYPPDSSLTRALLSVSVSSVFPLWCE